MSVHHLHRTFPVWTFGDRLRKVRRDNHLTQNQLADLLSASPKAVDAWESDRNKPRDLVAVATKIEDQFGLARGWMLGYADQPTGPGGTAEQTNGVTRRYQGAWLAPIRHLAAAA